ncbi:Ribonuclease H domain [Dillenia turbinata]|uniref:Ribonuclease H domain n=1 Tax=Dillenia turbinata TaxID=194707 RepID=A0AAN8US55_9MAGN
MMLRKMLISKVKGLKVMSKACHRCLKKSRFMEKEVCIVCGAKYCSNCVLRAMGSMPEGRKCVTCIGSRIHESLRGSLGKCSWMLKRLLCDSEIKQIMRRELLCEVNQPPPERIFVNGKRLSKEELNTLPCCPNPPKQLKPGSYWYDKVSGLWGKIGQRPSQIITHDLNVGNNIMKDASNGNTEILINGREMTKSERTLLQFFGAHCAGNPHFWVNADGSYMEEGQGKPSGHLWQKVCVHDNVQMSAVFSFIFSRHTVILNGTSILIFQRGTKLLCHFLHLPMPPKQEVKSGVDGIPSGHLQPKHGKRLFLVGEDGSGTSTIFKQSLLILLDSPKTLFLLSNQFSLDPKNRLDKSLGSSFLKAPTSLSDGSAKGSPGVASAGGIIRDSPDRWILEGLKLAKERNISHLLVESDSEELVALLNKGSPSTHPLHSLIKECNTLRLYAIFSSVIHVFREGNKCADHLARIGHSMSPDLHVFYAPPNSIRQLPDEDVMGPLWSPSLVTTKRKRQTDTDRALSD